MISKGSERGMQRRSAEKECSGHAGVPNSAALQPRSARQCRHWQGCRHPLDAVRSLTGDPEGLKSSTAGTSGKGSCFEVQVCDHLARFLQPCQVKFVPLAVGAQGALTEGVRDANIECSIMLEGIRN